MVPLCGALALSVLYPLVLRPEAIPKYISQRTSYHRVCLAFHPYPQLIQGVFNLHWFGPPWGLTPTSAWPWIDHPASGLQPVTISPCSDSLSLRLRVRLTSPLTTTRRLIMQKAVRHPVPKNIGLRMIVGIRFQVLFHSPHWGSFHLSLTVLVHYRCDGSI